MANRISPSALPNPVTALGYDGTDFKALKLDEDGALVTSGGGGAPAAHAESHQDAGSDEITVVGLSGLLADGQTPLAHKVSHQAGGSDIVDADTVDAAHLVSFKTKCYTMLVWGEFGTNSTNFVDVTDASVAVVVSATSTVLVLGGASPRRVDAASALEYKVIIDATSGQVHDFNAASLRHEVLAAFFAGVVAGSYTVKVQLRRSAGTGSVYLQQIELAVLVIPN